MMPELYFCDQIIFVKSDDNQAPHQMNMAHMACCEGARNFARTVPGGQENENIALKTYQGRLNRACVTLSYFTTYLTTERLVLLP